MKVEDKLREDRQKYSMLKQKYQQKMDDNHKTLQHVVEHSFAGMINSIPKLFESATSIQLDTSTVAIPENSNDVSLDASWMLNPRIFRVKRARICQCVRARSTHSASPAAAPSWSLAVKIRLCDCSIATP